MAQQAKTTSRVFELRCTVSGGLEDFALEELKSHFGSSSAQWSHRGNSGSQLAVEADFPGQELEKVVQDLKFVDYIHIVVTKLSLDNDSDEDALLSDIANELPRCMDKEWLESVASVGRNCQIALKEHSVGLERLPGKLLPIHDIDTGQHSQDLSQADIPGSVNTIYTKDVVAKTVVYEFCRFVKESKNDILRVGDILWLDAGAGSGAFLRHLPETQRLGVDLEPYHNEVHRKDYLETTAEWIQDKAQVHYSTLCVISNPPFAEGSRGDYSAIVKFLNHSIELGAAYIGVVVPANFARTRIWQSLGLSSRAQLKVRFFLPSNSFHNPATQKSVHIRSYFLLFECIGDVLSLDDPETAQQSTRLPGTFSLVGKRDKGQFPNIPTASLVKSSAIGLDKLGVSLTSSETSEFQLTIKLSRHQEKANLEISLLLNPERPLSLVNSISRTIPNHSLGWLSSSIKPPVACAILKSAIRNKAESPSVVVNAMSGETTIEMEAQRFNSSTSFFVISGDKNAASATRSQRRLQMLQHLTAKPLTVDLIVWDAQRLPLRDEVADLYIADLPFAGSTRIMHEEPSLTGRVTASSNKYETIVKESFRVLRSTGKAALISADTKMLSHSTSQFNWQKMDQSIARVNIGGISGQMFVLKKRSPPFKDVSTWVEHGARDMSQDLLELCIEAQQSATFEAPKMLPEGKSMTCNVILFDQFFHPKLKKQSHSYRINFQATTSEMQAKQIEQCVRKSLETRPPIGMLGLR